MVDGAASRRGFLSLLGGTIAAGGTAVAAPPSGGPRMRGLMPAADLLVDPAICHLQTGTLGLTPRPVFDATVAAARTIERDPLIAAYGPGKAKLDGVRRTVAGLIGCTMDEVLLTASTTSGMNMIAQGLRLTPGDRIVTTDQEHHGGSLCWDWLARRAGVHVDRVAVPPGEASAAAIVDRFAKAITPATKVLSFSHILYSTGLRMPVRELSALARDKQCISVVDGAQAVGATPVDVKALGCHLYAASGHKWLLGPKGTGILYISAELGETVDAMALQGGRQVNSDASGVANMAGLYGLSAAIDYLQAIGIARIEAHNLKLCGELRRALARMPKIAFAVPQGPLESQLVTFSLAGANTKDLRAVLADRFKVHVRAVDQNGYTALRASPHLYNNAGDGAALAAALHRSLPG